MHGPHLLIMLRLHHWPSTRAPLAWYSEQRAFGGDMIPETLRLGRPSFCASQIPTFALSDGFSSIDLPSESTTWFLFATSDLSSRFLPIVHLSNSPIWFLTSFQHGQWYNLCFSVPSSLLHPRHVFSSDQPMSYNLLSIQSPSTTSFLVTFRCLPVQASLVCLRSSALVGSSHTLSLNSSHALLPMCSSRPSWLVSGASFASCGQTTLMSTATCPSNRKVCHCDSLMPRSRVSHPTATASRRTSLHVWTSKICFLHASFCSVGYFPIQVTSAQACVAIVKSSPRTSRLFNSMQIDSETDSFLLLLPSASSTSAFL